MVARKVTVSKVVFISKENIDITHIIVEKYRRDFQGEYIDYIVAYTAFGNLAKRIHNNIKSGDTLKIDYRIETTESNGNYFTSLIIENYKDLNKVKKKEIINEEKTLF